MILQYWSCAWRTEDSQSAHVPLTPRSMRTTKEMVCKQNLYSILNFIIKYFHRTNERKHVYDNINNYNTFLYSDGNCAQPRSKDLAYFVK